MRCGLALFACEFARSVGAQGGAIEKWSCDMSFGYPNRSLIDGLRMPSLSVIGVYEPKVFPRILLTSHLLASQ